MAARRRAWTLEQKLALVSEMERCDNIAAFARERDLSTALLHARKAGLRLRLLQTYGSLLNWEYERRSLPSPRLALRQSIARRLYDTGFVQ